LALPSGTLISRLKGCSETS